MNPVKFEGMNTTFAKDQPQYLQLPAYVCEDGTVISEWEFSDEERARIAKGENLRLSVSTFNQPLQPLRPYLKSLVDVYQAEDRGKKENAFSERKCGDDQPPSGGVTNFSPGLDYDITKEE